MKQVLLITSYFPPETGAASNRIFHLAEGLKDGGFEVSVLTPLPNYPTGQIFEGYSGKWTHHASERGILIHRLWIFASNSKNKLIRLFAMLSYSFSLTWYFLWHKIPNTVIVQSPPLLVAFTCMLFLKSKKRHLILNVSDLWPIAGYELGALKKNFGYRVLESIETFNYRRASMVLGQSNEIIDHVKNIVPDQKTFLYRNFPNIDSKPSKYIPNKAPLKIVYAGLLGFAQGILKLCKELDYNQVEFHIYGSGAEQKDIESFISKNSELPVTYHGQVSRDELHDVLLNYDITIIPLLNRIYGSVPSKIFEYAKLGLPMLYFGGGEGESLIHKYRLGWVAEAGNYEALNTVIQHIEKRSITSEFREVIRQTAQREFDFNAQLQALVVHL